MLHRYLWRHAPEPDADLVAALAAELNLTQPLARLLARRGVTSFESARTFFRPSLANLHDPSLMRDMDRAVARLSRALDAGERILVHGDYDVDGITGCSMLFMALRDTFGAAVDYFIPDRLEHGYGLSSGGLDRAEALGATLIVAVDSGITAVESVAEAKRRGIEVVICDHHEPGDVLPDAAAVLDPKRRDCDYPCKLLTGCGVGFKLLQGLAQARGIDAEKVHGYLDFVALSIAADIVPITGENRTMMAVGADVLNSDEARVGFKALMETARMAAGGVRTESIVFTLAPRLNAVGRIASAEEAVALLVCPDPAEARRLALGIEERNLARRQLDARAFEEARALADRALSAGDGHGLVLHGETWHPGVIGIVAAKLVERYHRPTVVFATAPDGSVKGSARAVAGFDLYAALQNCREHLIQFGGHKYAAGMTIDPANLDRFRRAFLAEAQARLSAEHLVPELELDDDLPLGEVSLKFYKVLKQFAPFGPDNLRPIFRAGSVEPIAVRTVGADGQHLKLTVRQGAATMDAIGFGLGERAGEIRSGRPIDLAYQVDENTYRGEFSLQLRVRDFRAAERTS